MGGEPPPEDFPGEDASAESGPGADNGASPAVLGRAGDAAQIGRPRPGRRLLVRSTPATRTTRRPSRTSTKTIPAAGNATSTMLTAPASAATGSPPDRA